MRMMLFTNLKEHFLLMILERLFGALAEHLKTHHIIDDFALSEAQKGG